MFIEIWVHSKPATDISIFDSEVDAKNYCSRIGGTFIRKILQVSDFNQVKVQWEVEVILTREYRKTVYVESGYESVAEEEGKAKAMCDGFDEKHFDNESGEVLSVCYVENTG